MSGIDYTKVCFVVCPIGEPQSEIRKRSDSVLKHVIAPAVEIAGLNAVRGDDISGSGIITNQVVTYLEKSAVVIGDLTGHNPNVFYEVGIRHSSGRACILIIEKGQTIPFDLFGVRTIVLDSKDLDSAADAKEQIVRIIEGIKTSERGYDNPVSVARAVGSLAASDQPGERQIGEVLSAIGSKFQQAVTALEDQIRSLQVLRDLDPIFREVAELSKLIRSLQDEKHRRAAGSGVLMVKEMITNKELFPREFTAELRIGIILSLLLGRPLEAREKISSFTGWGMKNSLELVDKLEKEIGRLIDYPFSE